MPSPTVDYILGDVLMHDHEAGDITDLTTTLDPRYVNITGDTMTGGLTIQPATDTLTALVVNDKDSNNVLTVDTINNRVGIGVTSPGYPLDISASQIGLRLGADSTLTTRTNSTAKASVLCMPHYLTAEEDVGIYLVTSNNGYNTFNFGGGSSGKNAATYMLFYTAADGTTVTGTERMRIDNVGNVGIGTTSPGAKLDVYSTSRTNAQVGGTGNTYAYADLTLYTPNTLLATQAHLWDINFRQDNYFGGGARSLNFNSNISDGAGGTTGFRAPLILKENGDVILAGASSGVISNGNVGIRTTSPLNILHVYSGGALVGGTQIYAESLQGGYGSGISFVSKLGYAPNTVTEQAKIVADGTGNWTSAGQVSSKLSFWTVNANSLTEKMVILANGNVGIGTTAPTNILSLGGNSARIFWLERHTTANTAGNTLTVTAGGATSGATDKAGGALILQGGLSTGSAESGVTIQGCVAGATGTTDRTQTTMIQVLGNKLGFYTQTPIARAVLATGASHTVDDVITALQNLGLVSQS